MRLQQILNNSVDNISVQIFRIVVCNFRTKISQAEAYHKTQSEKY